jgi:hypothetical protein
MLNARRPVATPALAHPMHRRISSAGRASALQAEGRRFDPVILHHFYNYEYNFFELLAQLVEHLTFNQRVAGSNPA